jgi:predicted DNA-binding transcriptional regulator AlpA
MKDGRTPQLLFTESEVMAALRLSRTSVIKLRSEGKLVPVTIGKSIRYTNADISAFVDQLAVERQRRLNSL